MRAADAGEGVVAIGIVVNRDVGVALEARLDRRLRRGRHELVLAGDVQQQRLFDALRFAQHVLDADAVIADAAIGVAARRHEIGELAAEAIAPAPALPVQAGCLRHAASVAFRSSTPLSASKRPKYPTASFHSASVLSVIWTPGFMRQNRSGQRAAWRIAARLSAMPRITAWTPKISWMTTMPGPLPALGAAR